MFFPSFINILLSSFLFRLPLVILYCDFFLFQVNVVSAARSWSVILTLPSLMMRISTGSSTIGFEASNVLKWLCHEIVCSLFGPECIELEQNKNSCGYMFNKGSFDLLHIGGNLFSDCRIWGPVDLNVCFRDVCSLCVLQTWKLWTNVYKNWTWHDFLLWYYLHSLLNIFISLPYLICRYF